MDDTDTSEAKVHHDSILYRPSLILNGSCTIEMMEYDYKENSKNDEKRKHSDTRGLLNVVALNFEL